MNLTKLKEYFRRDGWLLAALALCVVICLLMGSSGNIEANDTQAQLCRVLSAMEGAGNVEVALYYGADSAPCGALVVADGATAVAVQLRLTNAVATLLSLDPDSVAVYPRQGGNP